jgi:hypothetical protein
MGVPSTEYYALNRPYPYRVIKLKRQSHHDYQACLNQTEQIQPHHS